MPPPRLSSLPEYIASLAALGRRPAIIEQGLYRGASIDYGGLLGKAFAWREELRRRGVKPGDRVMLWGASGIAWATAFYGCVLQGAVLVPLDASFSAGFAKRVREQTEAVLLCGDHEGAEVSFAEIAALALAPGPEAAIPAPPPETLLEIVYTSGATSEPKGVMITHGNLLANLRPIAQEIGKYKPKARLFLPLRFLHLIPLSHLFGQVMGLLIPPLLESAVIYPESQAPAQWAETIHRHRASAMIAVPQQIQIFSQWAAGLAGVTLGDAASYGRRRGVMWSWWHFRKLHRRLGWKMWAFISGGAALAPEIEDFWKALGYAVIQGYGLTETAPAIAITHPFKIRRGAVGRMLAGVETKMGADGEILVRGGNVSPGYYRNAEATQAAFADGWLHTGDLGRIDEEGNLHFLGRKKEVIVTADGLNVYPDDVERALNQQPDIAESAAVEKKTGQVHSVVVLRPGLPPSALDRALAHANAALEPHQRVRGASLWPEAQLPRTASTGKLQRVAIAAWVNRRAEGDAPPVSAAGAADWRAFVAQRWNIPNERLRPEASLDADLGLSSLDRVELWSWLEAHIPGAVDEPTLTAARTVQDLDRLAGRSSVPTAAGSRPAAAAAPALLTNQAEWPLRPSLRRFRAAAFPALVFPALYTAVSRVDIGGREHLANLQRPVLFIANHQSLLDVPVIVRALPAAWRPWLAPAMGVDPFAAALDSHASRWRRFRAWRRFELLRAFFNAYLLSERGAVAAALRHTGRVADLGFCPLIFPEGRRTPDGRLHPFRPGIGVFVANLRLPVVPIRLNGLFEILPYKARWPRRGKARVEFGAPLYFPHQSPDEITTALQTWFRIGL
ncbi:MAG TPA: AMP-binding protein [Terriglobales bacterium]|nr:AMP-binding protein [Terriglobales bacterium]